MHCCAVVKSGLLSLRRKKTRPAGFSLIELMIVLAIVSTIVALALPSSDSLVRDQLDAAGRIIISELDYARELAVSNNSRYRVTFDFDGHRFVLEHSGADATLDALPPSPFRSPQDPPDQHIVELDRLAGLRVPIRLYTAYAAASPIQYAGDVEFGPLGETTCPDETVVWLEAGAGSARRYLSLEINPVTGVATIGSLQNTAPPRAAAAAVSSP